MYVALIKQDNEFPVIKAFEDTVLGLLRNIVIRINCYLPALKTLILTYL